MERRAFITVVGGSILAWPLAGEAQREGEVIRVGILGNVPLTDAQGSHLWGGFIQELRTLGYIEGRNLKIEHRSSEGRYERLQELAAELVRLKVDVNSSRLTSGSSFWCELRRRPTIFNGGVTDDRRTRLAINRRSGSHTASTSASHRFG